MNSNSIHTCVIIDDSEIDLFITRKLLERSGVNVQIQQYFSLDDYQCALVNEAANSGRHTLVVSDLYLDMNNGFDVIRSLRSMESASASLMGICSNSEDPADVGRAMEAGADFFVEKPLNVDALEAICQQVSGLELCREAEGGITLLRA